jgi:UDP-N-acetyl-D-glucosamine dehydrogenase
VKGAKVLVLGAAYKADVDDPRESPAIKLMDLFGDRGADVSYHDPHIPKIPPMRHYRASLASVDLTEKTLKESDIVVIVTAHSAFDFDWIVRHAPQIVDTRNATRSIADRSKIVMA